MVNIRRFRSSWNIGINKDAYPDYSSQQKDHFLKSTKELGLTDGKLASPNSSKIDLERCKNVKINRKKVRKNQFTTVSESVKNDTLRNYIQDYAHQRGFLTRGQVQMSHISQLRAGISPTFTNKHYQFNHANDSILFTETFDISKFRVRVGPESDLEEHHLEFESERDQPIAQVTVMSKIELVNMKDQDGNTRLDENGKPQIEVQHSSLDFSISVFDEKLAPYLFNPDQDKQPLIDIANSRMQTEAAKLNSR